MNKTIIWLDGKFVSAEQACIPITTHTLHYGSGAFEGIRCYATMRGPALFRLSDHVHRLLKSFSCFEVVLPWTKEMIEEAIIDTVRANGFSDCYIRPILFFGAQSLQLSPKKCSVHCALIAINLDMHTDKDAITVGIPSVKRIHPDSMPIHNKINGFYVNSIFALHEVQERGFDEALLLDTDENIAEGSTANIFFVIDGILKTPYDHTILPGITRATILTIANQLSIPTQEDTISLHEIARASEAFFCGTATEIRPIGKIEKIKLPSPGPITKQIMNAFQKYTHPEDRSDTWLTFITKQ